MYLSQGVKTKTSTFACALPVSSSVWKKAWTSDNIFLSACYRFLARVSRLRHTFGRTWQNWWERCEDKSRRVGRKERPSVGKFSPLMREEGEKRWGKLSNNGRRKRELELKHGICEDGQHNVVMGNNLFLLDYQVVAMLSQNIHCSHEWKPVY